MKRCVALGMNGLELLANPSKTEFVVRDLNRDPTLPFEDASFDIITNSLSVDYLTSPLEIFEEMHRCLKKYRVIHGHQCLQGRICRRTID